MPPQPSPPAHEATCQWNAWAPWSDDTKPCISASKSRTRNCICFDGTSGNSRCSGDSTEITTYALPPCCVLTQWSPWSPSSKTCGKSTQIRNRDCLCTFEESNGKCKGPTSDSRSVKMSSCHVEKETSPTKKPPKRKRRRRMKKM